MKNHNRENLIDGVPVTFDINYIIDKPHKCCPLCNARFTDSEVRKNQVICTEEYEFYHKNCLKKDNIEYVHNKPGDLSSTIRLMR